MRRRAVALALLLLSSAAWARVEAGDDGAPLLVGEVATAHFRVRHTRASAGAAAGLGAALERAHEDFQRRFGRPVPGGAIEVRLGRGRAEFERIALPGAGPPSWAVALAYPAQSIILVEAHSLHSPEGPATLRHELAHVALGRLGTRWPRWFHEGLSSLLADEDVLSPGHYLAMFQAVQQERLLRLSDLTDSWPDQPSTVALAYAQSTAFVRHLLDHHGAAQMGALLDQLEGGTDFDTAFARVYTASVRGEEERFLAVLPARYSWVPLLTGSSALWALAAVLCAVGYAQRRRVVAERRAIIEAELAAERAAAALLANAEAESPDASTEAGLTGALGAPDEEQEDSDEGPDDRRGDVLKGRTLH